MISAGPAVGVGSAGPLPAPTPEASGGHVGSLQSAKSDRLIVISRLTPLGCVALLAGCVLRYPISQLK